LELYPKDESGELMRRHAVLAILLIVAIALPVFSQGSGTNRPSFEVASIKPNNSGDNRVMFRNTGGGRLTIAGATARMLIQQAYRIRDFQLSGGPGWISSDRFDVEAKAENVTDMTPERMPLLLQSLLEERFRLKTHTETKQLPTYELVVAKDGAKLKSVPEPPRPAPGTPPGPPPAPGGPMPPGSFRMGRGEMIASAIPLENFVLTLSQVLGRKVVDKTGLTGFFDIRLQWTPDPGQNTGPFGPMPGGPPPPADPAGPSIFTALQEQLGLRLESSKGPVEVVVIDSIDKPSEN
jgi:bla regulator protein blaR1